MPSFFTQIYTMFLAGFDVFIDGDIFIDVDIVVRIA